MMTFERLINNVFVLSKNPFDVKDFYSHKRISIV